MADYTPTTEEVRDGFADNSFAGIETVLRAAFDRWLADHDAEVRAAVLAVQGEPTAEQVAAAYNAFVYDMPRGLWPPRRAILAALRAAAEAGESNDPLG